MTIVQDIRHACRMYGRDRGLTFVVVATLALGIGVNTAVFGIIDSVLLHPLGGRDSSRLVVIYEHDRDAGSERNPVAPANLADLETRSRTIDSFAPLIWFAGGGANLGGSEPQRVQSALVSEQLFGLLGARAIRGRLFAPEDRYGNAILVSSALWRSRFAADPEIIGRNVTVDGQTRVVLGVLGAESPSKAQIGRSHH